MGYIFFICDFSLGIFGEMFLSIASWVFTFPTCEPILKVKDPYTIWWMERPLIHLIVSELRCFFFSFNSSHNYISSSIHIHSISLIFSSSFSMSHVGDTLGGVWSLFKEYIRCNLCFVWCKYMYISGHVKSISNPKEFYL